MVRSLIFFLFSGSCLFAQVTALYLTWEANPATTMTIHWHTPEHESSDTIYLQTDDNQWHTIIGSHVPLHYLQVHTVRLTKLKADTEYSFRIGQDPTIYKFRTVPEALKEPLRFIIGGDAYQNTKLFRKMNQTIMKQDPLFCVIGGDIAYAINGTPFQLENSPFNRWISFLSIWKEQMITPDGRVIPFILGAGNHDIAKDNHELFFTLFPFPEKRLYRAIDFGSYMSLILLDTNHLESIEGAQTQWLEQTLKNKEDFLYRFAIYHEGAYPACYSYQETTPKEIRTFWCPLFDKYKLTAAFENHNHAFKKTYPLKNGEIDSKGVIYFGDGCWGATPRKTHDMWYLEKRARKNCVFLIEIQEKQAKVEAIGITGKSLDTVTFKPHQSSLGKPQ